MRIENAELLDCFRAAGCCELCKRFCPVREPHHVRAKGIGGVAVEIRINLIALGGALLLPSGRRRFSCHCHRLFHDGHVPRKRIVGIVARRERVTPEAITEVMDWLRRLLKPTETELRAGLEGLSPAAGRLATRELTEAGVLTTG